MSTAISDDKMTAFSTTSQPSRLCKNLTIIGNDPDTHGKGKPETDIESPIDIPQLTTTTERRLMAKVDLHVLPFLCVLYLMAFLDRFVLFSPVVSGQCD